MVVSLSDYRPQDNDHDVANVCEPVTINMTITPAFAAEALRRNPHNRPLRQNAVATYARDMQAGKWRLNGETIKFATDGTLMDGQHRLAAVVASGVTIRAAVATDVQSDAMSTIDSGRKRTAANMLTLRREENSTALGAALRTLWIYEHGALTNPTGGKLQPTNEELLVMLTRHPQIRASVVIGKRAGVLMGAGVASALHYLFAQRDPEMADLFFEAFVTGANLSRDEPVYLLRQKFIQNRQNTKVKMLRHDVIRWVIKAWNLTRQGRRVTLIRALESDVDANEI